MPPPESVPRLHALITHPITRVLYLLVVAIGVFFLKDPRAVLAVCVLQAVLWLVLGLGPRNLLRRVAKLWVFALLIGLSYAVTAQDPELDRWIRVPLLLFSLSVNTYGLQIGFAMILRIVTVVLASQVARAGDAKAIAEGMRQLGAPASISMTVDTVLTLFGDSGGKKARDGASTGSIVAAIRRMRKGDVGILVDRFESQVERAEQHLEGHQDETKDRAWRRDIAIIAGIALTMLGIRALKVLPGMPIPPGHKLIFLTPLYVSATLLTRRRSSSTLTGLVMGIVSFLMGDGRYGIFNVFKHLAPGVVCDLGLGRLRRRSKLPGALFWTGFGALVAVARFATMFAIVLSVQAPSVAYALLVPGLISNITFGLLSGYVTWHLVKRLEPMRQKVLQSIEETG